MAGIIGAICAILFEILVGAAIGLAVVAFIERKDKKR